MKADWSALVDDLVDIDRPTNATCAPLHHTHTSLMNGNFLFVPPDKSMNWTSLGSLSEKWLFFLFSFGLPSLSIHWVCVKIRFKFAGFDSDEHSDLTVQLVPNFMIFNFNFYEINFSLFRFFKSIHFDLINYKI